MSRQNKLEDLLFRCADFLASVDVMPDQVGAALQLEREIKDAVGVARRFHRGEARPTITSADVKAWLEARIAELSIVGRPLCLKETRRLEAFMRSRDAIDDALGGDDHPREVFGGPLMGQPLGVKRHEGDL